MLMRAGAQAERSLRSVERLLEEEARMERDDFRRVEAVLEELRAADRCEHVPAPRAALRVPCAVRRALLQRRRAVPLAHSTGTAHLA